MSRTPSTMLPLGTILPGFSLPDTSGSLVGSNHFDSAPGLLVMFICNHCKYVKHIRSELTRLVAEAQEKGLAAVAINSNDVEEYPEDRLEKMAEAAEQLNFTFPYLYDETQEAAKAYRAACTPDFFLFDRNRKLVYRGQFDDSRPGNDAPVTGRDLKAAIDALLEDRPIPGEQRPSMGCNIKWKPGNEPEYFSKD